MKKFLACVPALLFAFACIGCTKPEPIAAPVPAEETVEFAKEAAVDFVFSDTFVNAVEAYQAVSGQSGREPKVVHAMENKIDDLDGYAVHALFLRIEGDVYIMDGAFDGVNVMVDLTTCEVYDNASINVNEWSVHFTGTCKNENDLHCLCMNGYDSFLYNKGTQLFSANETLIPLSEEQIAAINETLL